MFLEGMAFLDTQKKDIQKWISQNSTLAYSSAKSGVER